MEEPPTLISFQPPTLQSPRKKWKLEEHVYRIDVSSAKPIPWEKSHQLNWPQQLISYHIISGYESTGVILAELEYEPKHKGCIILKGMENVCSELFATTLAQTMGILAPRVRLVEYKPHNSVLKNKLLDNEWHYIKEAIENTKLVDEHRITIADQVKAEKMLNMAFFLVYEYLPSQIHLSNLQHQDFIDCNPQTNQIWFDLGKIVVLDMMINNFDRLPCDVWNNHGNPNNVMILHHNNTKRAVAIDQSVYCIDKQKFFENYSKYHNKVQSFFERIHRRDDALLSLIVDYLMIPKAEDGVRQFVKDQFILGVESAVEWLKKEPVEHMLKDLKKKVESMKTGDDWADVYVKGLEHIHLDFIIDMVKLIVKTSNCHK